MSDIWFVRAGRENVYAEDFLQKNLVAIGWSEIGEVPSNISKTNLTQLYKQTFPEHSDGKAQVAASQIVRFLQEIKVGDSLMTYDRDKQMYYVGSIVSEGK